MAENTAYDLAAGLISKEVLEEGWDFVSFVQKTHTGEKSSHPNFRLWQVQDT